MELPSVASTMTFALSRMPAASPTTLRRTAGPEGARLSPRLVPEAWMEDSKKARLMQLTGQQSAMIRAVKAEDGSEFYETVRLEDPCEGLWQDDPTTFNGMPRAVVRW
eukprot:s2135_g17.t1